MNKRFLVVLIITFLSVTAVHAQASVDPGNIFYDYATKWEAQGLVKRLPPMRPYPLANIKEILSNVIENGSEQDAELAKIIWEEETGRAWHFTFETDITYKNSSIDDSLSKDDFLLSLLPDAHGEISFFDDFVSFGYRIGADFFALGARDGLRTLYTNRPRDYADDTGHIGPFSMDLDVDSSISVGTTNLFFQGGLNRRGYGPFQSEGSIINDTVLHSPNFSLTYLNDFFSYTQSMFFVTATRSYDGQVHTFGKYFAFHALEFNFFKGIFSLAYVENIVFGERFEASYLLPVPYLAIQIMYDAADNLQMGFVFNYKPIKDLKFSAEFFVDEAAITGGIASLNPDSRYRFTFNIGGVYAPSESIVKDVHLNYLSIMPFTYSHWQYESVEV